jgi:hypothetical protein
VPIIEIICDQCGARFRCQASRYRKTCSRVCFRALMSSKHETRVYDDDLLKCENERDPEEHNRRIHIIKHNSMVNSGVLNAPLIPMDWLGEHDVKPARHHRNRKDKRFD